MEDRLERTVGKEKMVFMSNFSFSHSIFKRLLLQTRKKKGLVWGRVKMNTGLGLCGLYFQTPLDAGIINLLQTELNMFYFFSF